MINITNTAIHHIWKLLREKILGLHQKERNFNLFLSFCIYMRWWMLIQVLVVIISWYMYIKSLCSTSKTYTVLYANYISIKVEEKEYIHHMYMYFFFFMLYTINIWCICIYTSMCQIHIVHMVAKLMANHSLAIRQATYKLSRNIQNKRVWAYGAIII